MSADNKAGIAIEDQARDVLDRLTRIFSSRGHKLVLVGGTVRDRLLGRLHTDLDLATDASPPEIRACARLSGAEAIYDVGRKFGTVAILFPEAKVEISPYRTAKADGYDGIARDSALPGSSLLVDLSHRDFTINAMAQDITTGELFDPFNGRSDLEAGVIRAVESPDERFAEDPLRLLRAVRLAAELGFRIEPATAAAIKRHAASIQTVSPERVAAEISRTLLSPRPGWGIDVVCNLGLMHYIIPEVDRLRHMRSPQGRHKDVYRHTLQVIDQTPPELVVRLAALLHDIAKPDTIVIENGEVHFPHHEVLGAEVSRNILRRLRFPKSTVDSVCRLVLLHQRINQYSEEWTDSAVRRLRREADDDLEALFALCRADVTSRRPQKVAEAHARLDSLIQRSRRMDEEEQAQPLASPLNGHEIMALFGRPPGPWVGKVKNYLLSLVLEGQLDPQDKERAVELARELMSNEPDDYNGA